MAAYKGKDPNKPKRGKSAYFLFLDDFRAKNKGVFEDNKELLRNAGDEWKNLDDEEKKPYEEQVNFNYNITDLYGISVFQYIMIWYR